MRTRFPFIISCLFAGTILSTTALPQENPPNGQSVQTDTPHPKLIDSLKVDDSYEQFTYAYQEIEQHPDLKSEQKMELRIRYLVVAHQYLKTHRKPEKSPKTYVIPPGGENGAVDPATIKDPAQRAQYIKEVEENNALADAVSKHYLLSSKCASIIRITQDMTFNNPENSKLILGLLKKYFKDPEDVEDIKGRIEQEARKNGHKSPKWSDQEGVIERKIQ